MVVGTLTITLQVPHSTSLKEKRQVVRSLTARLRQAFNAAVAEVGDQDLWQSAVIGVAGGILGAAVAAGLSRTGNSIVDSVVPPVAGIAAEVFRPDVVVTMVAVGVAVLLSVGSGLLPAVRAAAQDPMKALHHE